MAGKSESSKMIDKIFSSMLPLKTKEDVEYLESVLDKANKENIHHFQTKLIDMWNHPGQFKEPDILRNMLNTVISVDLKKEFSFKLSHAFYYLNLFDAIKGALLERCKTPLTIKQIEDITIKWLSKAEKTKK